MKPKKEETTFSTTTNYDFIFEVYYCEHFLSLAKRVSNDSIDNALI